MKEDQNHNKRDGETLIMLGGFIVVLSLPVIAGTFFVHTADLFPKMVNLSAGGILFVIGVALALRGRKYLSRPE